MNAQIRKIAIETDAWCDKYYFGELSYQHEWEKKFADLIIEQCCYQVREIDAMQIRDHFWSKQ